MQKWLSYGQKCDFQYGGRRHLGFCWIRVLRVKAVQGPYSRCLYQIWCKSVQKWRSYCRLTDFKMVAAAILNLLSVSISSMWSSLDSGWACSLLGFGFSRHWFFCVCVFSQSVSVVPQQYFFANKAKQKRYRYVISIILMFCMF